MTPDSFIPFYGLEFLAAVEGQPDNTIVGYLCALLHYWHHNHCAGLKDDDLFLRKICKRDKDEWAQVREIIFDNDKFFALGEDGLWHQKRADKEWAKSVEKYDAQKQRSLAGAKQRWKGHRRK